MSTPKRNGDLLSKYLTSRPCAPLNLKPGQSSRPLLVMAGGPTPKGFFWKRSYPYWIAHLNGDPLLSAWLETYESFRAPAKWPVPGMPPQVTPRAFALAFIPSNENARLGSNMYKCPHLEVLAAWAHGWPVPKREWPLMEVAIEWLIRDPLFTVWAFDLDLEMVPLPFHDTVGYLQRLNARARLETDPLSCGRTMLTWALPEDLRTSLYRLGCLPRKSEGVGPSTKFSNLKRLDTPPPGG